ncbi:MAG: RusA family crossover junction endodeoxyribonuclease [Burkholderiales bacterium]
MSPIMSVFVPGVPIPKGSTKAFPFRRKNGKLGVAVTAANEKTKLWQVQMARCAAKEWHWRGGVWPGPIFLTVHFFLPRPKSVSKKIIYHLKKPDLDKLLRTVLDALTGIAYLDDAQVVTVQCTKSYTCLQSGAHIYVERLD